MPLKEKSNDNFVEQGLAHYNRVKPLSPKGRSNLSAVANSSQKRLMPTDCKTISKDIPTGEF